MRIFQNLIILMFAIFLLACTEESAYVPVVDAIAIERIPESGTHVVHHGETLYSIAWRYGLDYRQLARRNGLTSPYYVRSGELLYLNTTAPVATRTANKAVMAPTPVLSAIFSPEINADNYFATAKEPQAAVGTWAWPARGNIIGEFSSLNKGINISGAAGAPIYAAAAGKVVYSGNGLRGYGNLLIIKHNSTFLTAYAHNQKNLVVEGQWVKIGQVIAEMGDTGSRRVMLHFEIRVSGQPVNPLLYLDKR
jgi:lipoprotein NlpD